LNKDHDLTQGSVLKVLIRFALPFLFSNFMQALYGAVDLMVVGQFSGVSAISAVNIGSQIMQIVTCFIIGISMGVTVKLAHAVGCRDDRYAARIAGSTFVLFALLALAGTPLMLWQAENMAALLHTPAEAMTETVQYVRICSAGLPFIIVFNVIAGLLRGLGDSKTPMYFVGIACGVNVAGDLLLVSVFGMGVAGAALATTAAQFISSAGGALYLVRHKFPFGFSWKNVRLDRAAVRGITAVGLPIAMQDTLINISFILLTVIANGRGLVASSAVGVVEKLMMFMFLVPDAMLSAISTITAQNVGAGKPERAVQSVKLGIAIAASFGAAMCALSWTVPSALTGIFSKDAAVIASAGEYLKTYSIDCILVAFTFCLNGYLCGTEHSMVTFIHNVLSIFLVRIPAAYYFSIKFPESLLPMGLASPLGSVASLLILAGYFLWRRAKRRSIAS
jgi:putative MATE family efflux protein